MKKVAAFDFDGTLAKGDAFFPFLLSFKKWGLLGALPDLLSYPWHRDRRRLKEAMMKRVLKGMPYEKVALQGERFYHSHIFPRLKPSVVDRVRRHREEGDQLILISANISPILLPVKEKLGFDTLICSELELEKGKITGKLSTPNCRGLEKLVRILPFLEEGDILEAYGDSEGDRELLEKANISHWIT